MNEKEFKLLEAAGHGNIELVKSILNDNVDINCIDILIKKHLLYLNLFFFITFKFTINIWNLSQTFNFTPLMRATLMNHIEVVSYLLSQPNIDKERPDIFIQEHS